MGVATAESEQAARRLAELIDRQRGAAVVHSIRLRREEIPLVVRQATAQLRVDGVLSLSDGRNHKRLRYRQGELAEADSSVEADWLGKMLLAEGRVTATELNAAERAVGPRGTAVGAELAARGLLSRAELEAALVRQREAVVASLGEWEEAEASWEDARPASAATPAPQHGPATAETTSPSRQTPPRVGEGQSRETRGGERSRQPSLRPTLLLAAFYLVLGFVLAYLPLTNYLGLEFSLAVCLAAGLIAGPFAVGQSRTHAGDAATTQWARTIAVHTGAACLSLAGLAFRVLTDPPCAPWRGAGFFVLLPVVTIAYGGAWGVACGRAIRRKRLAQVVVVLIALATLLWTGLGFLRKPTVWAYNPFFGHFPGPIYDEGISPTATLVYYRLSNLAQAWLLVLATGLVGQWRALRSGARKETPAVLPAAILAAVLAATALGLHLARFELGWDMDDAHLKRELSGQLRTPHFDLRYPKRADIEREIEQIARDHEFRFAQIERELGIAYPHRITSFIYASEAEKKRLIGAASTEYADCAKHQMHLNWEHLPIEILHHEMTHVMLSDYGLPALGFSLQIAVTEGMATAFGGPYHWDQDLDRWAAGMLAMNRLPRMKQILGARFWSESGARAYVAAGSFIRFLAAKPDGPAKLLRAYRRGDLARQFGQPLRELDDEWRASLAAIQPPLTGAEIERARSRFGAKSMFEMRCPREVARLLDAAGREADRRYFHKADLLYRQAAELDRNEARLGRLRLPALLRLGRLDEAEELARRIVAAQGTPEQPARNRRGEIVGSQLIAHDAELTLADIAWARGRTGEARSIYQRIAGAAYRPSTARQALAALYAFDHPGIEPALRAYFTGFTDLNAGRWELTAAGRAHPDDPMLGYLLARRAVEDGGFAQAAALLRAAIDNAQFAPGPADAPLRDEAVRALGYSHFMLGESAAAKAAFELLRDNRTKRAESALVARDWLARIEAWPGLAKPQR